VKTQPAARMAGSGNSAAGNTLSEDCAFICCGLKPSLGIPKDLQEVPRARYTKLWLRFQLYRMRRIRSLLVLALLALLLMLLYLSVNPRYSACGKTDKSCEAMLCCIDPDDECVQTMSAPRRAALTTRRRLESTPCFPGAPPPTPPLSVCSCAGTTTSPWGRQCAGAPRRSTTRGPL
jgi:hypothetical protein